MLAEGFDEETVRRESCGFYKDLGEYRLAAAESSAWRHSFS